MGGVEVSKLVEELIEVYLEVIRDGCRVRVDFFYFYVELCEDEVGFYLEVGVYVGFDVYF